MAEMKAFHHYLYMHLVPQDVDYGLM